MYSPMQTPSIVTHILCDSMFIPLSEGDKQWTILARSVRICTELDHTPTYKFLCELRLLFLQLHNLCGYISWKVIFVGLCTSVPDRLKWKINSIRVIMTKQFLIASVNRSNRKKAGVYSSSCNMFLCPTLKSVWWIPWYTPKTFQQNYAQR
jgi:hypothetical protein